MSLICEKIVVVKLIKILFVLLLSHLAKNKPRNLLYLFNFTLFKQFNFLLYRDIYNKTFK
jgi:hypothetical protein